MYYREEVYRMFEQKLTKWTQEVLASYDPSDRLAVVNTHKMMMDIDRIIAEAFDHAPMLTENC